MTLSIADLKGAIAGKTANQIIACIYASFPHNRLALASSLSIEDQILTHIVLSVCPSARIFTLDTGRHFQETYNTMARTMEKYGFRYEILFPDSHETVSFINKQGPNAFYRSVDLRKECCAIRKTRPLAKILSTLDLWICGLRRDQAITRTLVEPIEWDAAHNIIKANPIYDWSEEKVWDFVRAHDIPFNPLQEKGFRSIGCLPCTRATGADEDIRAGRWWWEDPLHKECGLHGRHSK